MKLVLVAALLLVAGCGGTSSAAPAKTITVTAPTTQPNESAAGLRFRIVAGVAGPVVQVTKPSATPTSVSSASTGGSLLGTELPSTKGQSLDQAIAWAASPPPAWATKFSTFTCAGPTDPHIIDDPDEPLLTCDSDGTRYLLSKAVIEGTSLKSASAGVPQNELEWAVSLQLNTDASRDFAKISQKLLDNKYAGADPTQFAMVLDGQVLSAPQFTSVIKDGRMQISGSFNEANAKALAERLSRH